MGVLGCTLVTAVQQAHSEGVFWGMGPGQARLGSSFTSTLMMTVSSSFTKVMRVGNGVSGLQHPWQKAHQGELFLRFPTGSSGEGQGDEPGAGFPG